MNIKRTHLPTSRILRTLDEAYALYRELSNCGAEDRNTLDYTLWDMWPYEEPVFDNATHKRGDHWVEVLAGDPPIGTGTYTWEVVPKTVEELAAERQDFVDRIFSACEEYIDTKGGQKKGRVSKYSIGVLTMKVTGNKPKSKAINDWVNACFGLAYTREAQINGGAPMTDAMLDFSSCGMMPYTVAEALME